MLARRRRLLGFFLGTLSAVAHPLRAQQPKVYRVGFLESAPMAANEGNLAAFRKGLAELGFVEGRNLLIEYRSAEGRTERFPELATELVRMKIDVFVIRGTQAAQAAKNASARIPIVAAAVGDPVASGLVKSLSRPGGNFTGLNSFASEIWGKRVQLLRQALPLVTRIGRLDNPDNPLVPPLAAEINGAARSLGAETRLFELRRREDLESVFDAALTWRAGALLVGIDAVAQAHRKSIVELAAKHRLPAMYASREFVEAGGLMSYGVSYSGLYYRAANFVGRILKGAKPGDLPIEQPTKLELVINRKTAKVLGIRIPLELIGRADEVID